MVGLNLIAILLSALSTGMVFALWINL